MGFWQRVRQVFTGEERLTLKNPADWAVFLEGMQSTSGAKVNTETSLKSSSFYGPLVITMNTIAGLPKQVRRITERGSQNDKRHDQYVLFAKRPNPYQTSEKFWAEFVFNIRRGNGLALLDRNQTGRPTAYWNLNPERATPDIQDGDLFIKYDGKAPNGRMVGTRPYRDFIHVPNDIGLTQDEIGFVWGRPTYEFSKETIGLNLALERSLALFLKEQGILKKWLSSPNPLTAEQRKVLAASLKKYTERHGAKEGGLPLFDNGLEIKGLNIPLGEISPSEVRSFGIEEGARFQTFPALFKLGHHERANFANAFQASIEFRDMIGTFLKPIEAECNYKLLTPSEFESDSHFFHFETKGLLQADPQQRAALYQVLNGIGALTPNMALDIEDMDQMGPEGDIATTQVQNIPLELIVEYWQSQIQGRGDGMQPRNILKKTNGVHKSTN